MRINETGVMFGWLSPDLLERMILNSQDKADTKLFLDWYTEARRAGVAGCAGLWVSRPIEYEKYLYEQNNSLTNSDKGGK